MGAHHALSETRVNKLPTFVSVLVISICALIGGEGCTPADWAGVNAAGRAAQGVACAVCGTAAPDVQEQAAALSRSIAQLTEAIAILAAQKDAGETAALLDALRAREAQDRADFERLVKLAQGAPLVVPSAPEVKP